MAKVRINTPSLDNLIETIYKAIVKVNESKLKKVIVDDSIALGISPVKGEGKYQKYSQSYKDAIKNGRYKKFSKTISPVTLKLSGKLHDSFYVDKTSTGMVIGFKNKLAHIHTVEGAGKSKVIRKMLPVKDGEDFKPVIKKEIINLLKAELDNILGKIK